MEKKIENEMETDILKALLRALSIQRIPTFAPKVNKFHIPILGYLDPPGCGVSML